MIKILDLFCGVGGVARGFQRYLKENDIPFVYVGVDVDEDVLKAHRILNPDTWLVKRDAFEFDVGELAEFDFVWASPPCESHSRLMWIYNKNCSEKWREPDGRLWNLIIKLHNVGIPFVVENVEPYYRPLIRPTSRAGRHRLWSNLKIAPVSDLRVPFDSVKDRLTDLKRYHDLPDEVVEAIPGDGNKRRDVLRDMVHHEIAYRIARQVIPQVLAGRTYRQTVLDAVVGV